MKTFRVARPPLFCVHRHWQLQLFLSPHSTFYVLYSSIPEPQSPSHTLSCLHPEPIFLLPHDMVCKGKLRMTLKQQCLKLTSVTNASIRGFTRWQLRTIDAYSAGLHYGTEFKQNVYV